VSRHVAVRATALFVAAIAVLVAMTLYFSSEKVPPCLVSGVDKWQPPTDSQLHRFEVVVPDRALCFFDMDNHQELVGYIAPKNVRGITAVAPRGGKLAVRYDGTNGAIVDLVTGAVRYGVKPPPPPSDTVQVADAEAGVAYSTRPGTFGLRANKRVVGFEGFTWNPRFGPNPPDHGLSLAPDRPELWVLDAPNSVVHVFNVDRFPPRRVVDIRLTKPLSGDESPCTMRRCTRIGWLQHSNDGRFVYVGDAGDVIDTKEREEIANLEALHNSRVMLEVDWYRGKPVFAR
jgi:hypothetical protein